MCMFTHARSWTSAADALAGLDRRNYADRFKMAASQTRFGVKCGVRSDVRRPADALGKRDKACDDGGGR